MTAVDGPDAVPLAEQQLADVADLVATGPVDMGAFTQAEMAVVLGDVPALAGVQEVVLAEAVRSLAARGVCTGSPGRRPRRWSATSGSWSRWWRRVSGPWTSDGATRARPMRRGGG